MTRKSVKITVRTLAVIIVLLVAASYFAGVYMFGYALMPRINRDMQAAMVKECARYPGLTEWVDSLLKNGTMRDTSALDADGYDVHAYFAEADVNTGRTAIIIHGYTSNPMSMMMLARMYRDVFGYNILLPKLNFHAESEGSHIQMGWYDRLDIEQVWIPLAHETFADSIQVIHGISMGGATTMMTSGDELPDYVRGFVDDCGYSSAWDEFKYKLKDEFGLPAFPVLHCASLVCKSRYGWSFKEASSVRQLAKCEKPMLFIHGDADAYVPLEEGLKSYEAKTKGYKHIWIPEGTTHAMAFNDYPQEYTDLMAAFLSEQIEK